MPVSAVVPTAPVNAARAEDISSAAGAPVSRCATPTAPPSVSRAAAV